MGSIVQVTSLEGSNHPPVEDIGVASPGMVVCAALDGECLADDRAPAREFRAAVAALERTGVPVITWSTHTRAEIEMARQEMGIHAPFISENGAALFVPAGYFPFVVEATRRVPGYDVVEFGMPYEQLAATLRRVARAMRIDLVTLADMTIEEVATDFGLELLAARLAKLREYGELFRVIDEGPASRGRLFRALRAAGLTCSHGDRYDLVRGLSDRAGALQVAHRLMRRARGRVVRIGIGSRAEDLPVLAQADIRILIRQADPSITAHLVARMPAMHVIDEPGIGGWLEAITRVMSSVSRGRR
jgi:mannosyl-3-phosphoglycerate phosphatase family protein